MFTSLAFREAAYSDPWEDHVFDAVKMLHFRLQASTILGMFNIWTCFGVRLSCRRQRRQISTKFLVSRNPTWLICESYPSQKVSAVRVARGATSGLRAIIQISSCRLFCVRIAQEGPLLCNGSGWEYTFLQKGENVKVTDCIIVLGRERPACYTGSIPTFLVRLGQVVWYIWYFFFSFLPYM